MHMTISRWIFLFIFVGYGFSTWAAQAAINKGQITVAYFTMGGAEHFESKIKPMFKQNANSCKSCEIVNLTPYNKEGKVDIPALVEALKELPANTSFVFFDFNLKNTETTKELTEILNTKAAQGLVVVAAAGVPQGSEASSPLSRTVLGQVPGALIIGELSERDRLMPQGFYGPEMLTAVRPPKGMMGLGYGPLLFASALAENWQRRASNEWVDYFKTKKMKNRKIWMDLNDLF